MNENVLIPLPQFYLPLDFPWQVRFVEAVEQHLRLLRTPGDFVPPRFFGFFFKGDTPVGVGGSWTVALDPDETLSELKERIESQTAGLYSICSDSFEATPDYVLIFDRRDGACWLWSFAHGMRFVEATEPVLGDETGSTEGPSGQWHFEL